MRQSRPRRGRLGSLLLGLALALAPTPGDAAEGGLTLAEAVERALREGTAARIAQLEADAAGDALRETRGTYLPHVAVTSNAGYSNRRDERLRALDRNGRERVYGLSTLGATEGWFNFTVDQLLFDLRQLRLIEREELAAEVARLAEDEQRERVAAEVTRRFADVVRLQRLAALATRQVSDARWLDEQAAKLLDAGRALETDRELVAIYEAEVELETRLRAKEEADARRDLWRFIGEETALGTPGPLAADSLPSARLDLGTEAVEEAMAQAPELRLLDLRRRMGELGVEAASARRLPTVGLRAGYANFGDSRREDNYEDELSVGLQVRVPLFDGFQTRSAIARARKQAEIARLRYKSALERKRGRIRELLRRLGAAEERVVLAQRRAAAARERQRLTDLRLQVERSSVEDALEARERTVAEEREAADSRFQRIELWTSLQSEMGRLSGVIAGDAAAAP